MIVVWLFLTVPWVCLQFVVVVFTDHSHYADVAMMKDSRNIRMHPDTFLIKK